MIFLKTALSATAIAMFVAGASFAQSGNPVAERLDATGKPTALSTPAEQAETARINRQIGTDNRAMDDRAKADNTRYQAERTQYQGQRTQYEGQLQNNQAQQAEYDAKSARYDELRDRYAAERAAYHRGAWPRRYASLTAMERDDNLVGNRVELINGRSVGTVTDTSHGRNGSVTAVFVRLDNNRTVWIDATDVRYDRGERVIMTNLDRNDLRRMADHRL